MNKFLFTMTAYQKAKGLLRGRGPGIKISKYNININIGQNTHHDKRDNNTTWQQHNMVQTLLGTDNSTKGKKVETTIHYAKQPQLLVRVSTIESLNEEIEIKLSSLSVCCSLFQLLAAVNLKDE